MLLNLKEILSVAKENHFAIGAFNTSDPVSYTHLDVYKRQLHQCLWDRAAALP